MSGMNCPTRGLGNCQHGQKCSYGCLSPIQDFPCEHTTEGSLHCGQCREDGICRFAKPSSPTTGDAITYAHQRPVLTDRCQFCGEPCHPGLCQPAAATGAKREKLNVQPYDLVPFQEITDGFARVAEFGAVKYEAWNWSKGLSRVQLIGSLLRHTFAYLRGQERDADSGLLHTDHILWNAVALTHNVHHNLEDGRRPEPVRYYHE